MSVRIRSLVSTRRFVVALTFLLAGSVALHPAERRRTKVIFSDSKDPSSLPPAATQAPLQTPPTEFFPRGSSLDAVTAPPFASPSATPRTQGPLTDRDALDNKKDWLIKSVQSLDMGGDATAKAFGVRDYTPKTGALVPSGREKSPFDKPVADQSPNSDNADSKNSRSREENRWKDFSPAANRERPFMPVVNSSSTKTGSENSDTESAPVIFSDTDSFSGMSSRDLDNLTATSRNNDLVRAVLNPVNPGDVLSTLKRDAANRDTASPRDEFRALLGLGRGQPPTTKGPIGGPGDAVNLQPDMTRQEINPVVPRPGPGVKTSDLPSFSPNPALETVQNQFRPPLLDTLPSRAFAPAGEEPSLAPVTELRTRLLSPTILPVPKRSF